MTNLTSLNVLLDLVLKSYFFSSRCIFLFTEPISDIELHPSAPIIYLNVHENTLNPNLIFQHHGCQDVIIHHENASDVFIQYEKLIRLKTERFNTRRFVVTGGNALQIFQSKEVEYVSDMLVVHPRRLGYELITHSYNRTIGRIEAVILDFWYSHNRSFAHNADLFPDKLYNQNGREIRIGTFTYEPYSIVGDDNETFFGTETSFIMEFVKKYNFTPRFTVIGDDLWGDIYKNWTGIGILGSLVNDEIDIGYAALYTWDEYYKYLDYTKPLTRTGVTCLVPAPQLAAGWLTPLHSFSAEMWLALLVMFTVDSVVLSCMLYENEKGVGTTHTNCNAEYFTKSLLIMAQMYLLQSVKIRLKRNNILKYFIGLNLVTVLLVSSSYSSGLSSVMTVPRYMKTIKTVKDLALSKISWGAPTDAWLISLRNVDEEDYKLIKSRFVVKNDNDLVAASKSNEFGFSLERLPYGHYAAGSYVQKDVISNYRIMQEDIYWEQCIFMVRKNSILLPLLDDLILKVFEAGLESYWENKVVFQFMDTSVQRGIWYYSHNRDRSVVKLKWIHVEGAFGVLAIGYLTAILVLLIEILVKRNM